MITTRRDFFKTLFENVREKIILPEIFEAFINNEKKDILKPVIIGHISDFQPKTATIVNEGKHVLVSKFEGLFVLNADDFNNGKTLPRIMIELNRDGYILLKPDEVCPELSLLSMMTGEFILEEEL